MNQPIGPSRRAFLAAASASCTLALSAGQEAALADVSRSAVPVPGIIPRTDWGGDLTPTRPLDVEASGDVRFLMVHHTQTPNGYDTSDVTERLRGIYGYHTGTKGWPDVAYNFFVDAFGRVWEGRTGSLDGPVQGDATGGSQGYALLCCFVGDHSTEPPTPAAQEAMAELLAHLADRYRIDLCAGRTITFTSRGSSRWPAGATVTTEPIAGHRDMSQSACPGDAAYELIRPVLLTRALQMQGRRCAADTTTTSDAAAPVAPLPASSIPTSPTATDGGHENADVSDGGNASRPGFGGMTAGGLVAALGGASAWAVRRRLRTKERH